SIGPARAKNPCPAAIPPPPAARAPPPIQARAAFVAAGGGGMAAGQGFLALAGPIGWAIGGTALAAGGWYTNKKNKQAAVEANKERFSIEKALEYGLIDKIFTNR
ncbi:hypothetical protein ACT453_38125, partial [Bacillus sp. D-CC]